MPPKQKPFEYTALDKEMQRQILVQRISQLEQEHYNHAMNLAVILTKPESPETERARLATQEALAELEKVIVFTNQMLADL